MQAHHSNEVGFLWDIVLRNGFDHRRQQVSCGFRLHERIESHGAQVCESRHAFGEEHVTKPGRSSLSSCRTWAEARENGSISALTFAPGRSPAASLSRTVCGSRLLLSQNSRRRLYASLRPVA